jgi:DNA repair protein RecO (recombination protein O)
MSEKLPVMRQCGVLGFVLHRRPWRETSLWVDVFTRTHGRVALLAKGARRPQSQLRGLLQSFQPLAFSWAGRKELKNLSDAKWVGGVLSLSGLGLLCGFYLNELIVRLCPREVAHEKLFDQYTGTLARLAAGESPSVVLRAFECVLLQELGYARDWAQAAGQNVEADLWYVCAPQQVIRSHNPALPSEWPVVRGQTLLDLAVGRAGDYESQLQSKLLMRRLLDYHLRGEPLASRQTLIQIQQL